MRKTPKHAPNVHLLGYWALMEQYGLQCPAPRVKSRSVSATRSIRRQIEADGTEQVDYPQRAYRLRDGLADHLEFALKNEPLELTVLAALFEKEQVQTQLQQWLTALPASAYARMAGHLFEWLTQKTLNYQLPPGARRVHLLDPHDCVVGPQVRNPRFGVVHNLIGTRDMSPLVRLTQPLKDFFASDLKARVGAIVAAIEPELLDRAVSYLYLAETRSSFAIERETAGPERQARFRKLLERAGAPGPLTQEELVTWQNEIIASPLLKEHSFRAKQNWLSRNSSRASVEYIPPAPGDVDALMQGVSAIAEQASTGNVEPFVAACCASFGMVFVHPFLDGNGRLHRFLLHHVLRQCGITPEGIVLPISVALEARAKDYAKVLQTYARPRTELLHYMLDRDTHSVEVKGFQPAWLYAYFDATQICELVAQCIDQALNEGLPAELAWLQAYDKSMGLISQWLEGEQSQLSLLIRCIVQNDGRLSKSKRSRFEHYTDEDIAKAEQITAESFRPWASRFGKGAKLGAEHLGEQAPSE